MTDGQVEPSKARFLLHFAELGNVTAAARAAGVARRTVYDWIEHDASFRAAFDDAESQAIDVMDAEARRRAVEGVTEPVYQRGEHVGDVQRYSDRLLIFLLQSRNPKRYRQMVEHTGAVEHRHKLDLTKLTPEELDALERIVSRG